MRIQQVSDYFSVQYYQFYSMQCKDLKGQQWKYKPKYCSHSFRKFKTISNQNQKNDKIVNSDIALKSIGVIRSIWKSHNNYQDHNAISGFIFGTGFMLSKNILMTCAHNVYSKTKKSFAHQVQFIPGIQKGRVCEQSKSKYIIRTASLSSKNPRNFFTQYSTDFINDNNSELEPALQQICLIILDPISGGQKQKCIPQKFLQIGNINEDYQPIKLRTYGYPSDKFKYQIKLQKASFERYQLDGFLHSIGSFQIGQYSNYSTKIANQGQHLKAQKIDQIINYTMKTKVGCSGSPILAKNDKNQLYIVGIHTHKGREDDYNSGVYFGKHLIKLIKQLEKALASNFKLKFPEQKEQKIGYHDVSSKICLIQLQKNLIRQKKDDSMESSECSYIQDKKSLLVSKKDDSLESSEYSSSQQKENNWDKESPSPFILKKIDSIGSSECSQFDEELLFLERESQNKQEEEESHKSSSEAQVSSQYSSCIDEDYIQDFYNFLTIEKTSNSPQNKQSFEYFSQASKRVLIFFNNLILFAQQQIFSPKYPRDHGQKISSNPKRQLTVQIWVYLLWVLQSLYKLSK